MSLADYASRKYDFLALQGVKPRGQAKLELALFSAHTAGKICAGVQKLAQRWLLEFLTEFGSMPGAPERGCTFMTLVRTGRLRTQLDVTQGFYAANLRVRTTLQAEEYSGMPDDERFDDVNLLGVAFYPGYLNLSVQVLSRAGDDKTIILPVETLP